MKCCFVRGLWGDSLTQARPKGNTWYTLIDEVKTTLAWPHQAMPCKVFSFGRDNQKSLSDLGVVSTLLSEDAVKNYTGQTERAPVGLRAWTNYGASMWRQKFECIAAALKNHDAVVWIDWNVRLVKPLPSDFWDRINPGPPLKSNVGGGYAQKQCNWRTIEPRRVHHAWFLYVRGLDVANRLIELSAMHPTLYDEPIVAKWIDEYMGGEWKGSNQYKADGFEPYCNFDTWRGGVHPHEELVFRVYDK